MIVEEEGERIEVDLDCRQFSDAVGADFPPRCWLGITAAVTNRSSASPTPLSTAATYSPSRTGSARSATGPRFGSAPPSRARPTSTRLLARSISFHFMENGVYEERCNPNEAAYIAQLGPRPAPARTRLSIGVVAFSEAQQSGN